MSGPGIWAPGEAWLGLGLNQPPLRWRWRRLLVGLARLPGIEVIAVAGPLANPAVGPGVRGLFLNGAAHIRTTATPPVLLGRLKRLEARLGRRGRGDRPADLDLLLWRDRLGWRRLDHPALRLPHPATHRRPFVLDPLLALAPPRPLPPALESSARARRPVAGAPASRYALGHVPLGG